MRRDRTPEREKRREVPLVVVKDSPVVQTVSQPTGRVTVAANPAVTRPSAPPEEPRTRSRAQPKESRDESSERKEKKEKKDKKQNDRARKVDDVQAIRDAEARRERLSAKDEERRRKVVKERKEAGKKARQSKREVSLKYPTKVTWVKHSERMSFISLLNFGWLVTIIVLMIVSWVYYTVHLPTITESTSTSFIYGTAPNAVTYTKDSTSGLNDLGTTESFSVLLRSLLGIPNQPTVDCGGSSTFTTLNKLNALGIAVVPTNTATDRAQINLPDGSSKFYVNERKTIQFDAGLISGAHGVISGSYCTGSQYAVGYCVRNETCAAIASGYYWGKYSIASLNEIDPPHCSDPLGPMRVGSRSVPESFLELMTKYWYIAVAPVAAGYLLGIAWLVSSVMKPGFAPFSLALVGVLASVGCFVADQVGLVNASSNYYILIYAGLVLLFVLLTFKHQKRVGSVFKLGCGMITGDLTPQTESAGGFSGLGTTIVGPVVMFVTLHAIGGILLLLFAGAGQHVLYFTFSDDFKEAFYGVQDLSDWSKSWADWISNPIFSTTDMEEYKNIVEKGAYTHSCQFRDLLKFTAGAAVMVCFYLFTTLYLQFGTRVIVSSSVADSYFIGTKNYQTPPGGLRNVGWLGFRRAFVSSGDRVIKAGVWNSFGSSGPALGTTLSSFLNLLVSPIEAIVYGTFGWIVGGVKQDDSRFGLIHSSMFPGSAVVPKLASSNTMAKKLVSRTYGSAYATIGDSPEIRFMLSAANLLAVACGLGTWIWADYVQNISSVASMGGYVFLVLYLTGSAIARPGLFLMIAMLVDLTSASVLPNVEYQAARNGVLGFIMVSALTASILRGFLEVPAAALDTVVYCFAIERTKRRRIRSLEVDSLIHKDYVGDSESIPPGTTLERVMVNCPATAKPNDSMTIELDGRNYDIRIPPGAKAGRSFEIAVPVPINNLDLDEEEEESDFEDSEDSDNSEENGPAVVANQPDESIAPTMVQQSRPSPRDVNATAYQY